jgi:hypothetical protein
MDRSLRAAVFSQPANEIARERADRYLGVCEACKERDVCRPAPAWYLLSHFPCGKMWDRLAERPQ